MLLVCLQVHLGSAANLLQTLIGLVRVQLHAKVAALCVTDEAAFAAGARTLLNADVEVWDIFAGRSRGTLHVHVEQQVRTLCLEILYVGAGSDCLRLLVELSLVTCYHQETSP